jgi:hypothetical protein
MLLPPPPPPPPPLICASVAAIHQPWALRAASTPRRRVAARMCAFFSPRPLPAAPPRPVSKAGKFCETASLDSWIPSRHAAALRLLRPVQSAPKPPARVRLHVCPRCSEEHVRKYIPALCHEIVAMMATRPRYDVTLLAAVRLR